MIEIKLFAPLSPNVVSTIIVVGVLSIIFVITGLRIDKQDPKEAPKGFLFLCVLAVDFFNDFIREHLSGNKYKIFGPYLFAILIFLSTANTIALIGLRPPLANLGVAMSFTVISFFAFNIAEFRFNGLKGKIKSLIGPVKPIAPLMLPINLIGEISTPLTMGLRLFGNLMSGAVIAAMVYTALHWSAGIFAGVFVHAVFDIFFGLIQAFVFFMLSVVNLSMAADPV